MSAMANNDVLAVKARCAELELMNAHLRDELQTIKSHKANLEEQLRNQNQRIASQSSSQFQEELFTSQKEVLRLTDHKASLEQQLEKANETVQMLHKNIAREVQKAKDEVERQSIFLRSQILEQKEINTSLQEKLMTALRVSKQFEDQGMYDNVTETILITSDAVLQKMRQEFRNSVKGKYDVNADITGRSMTLSGRRVNVQLLKAEVMTALNEAYCALVDPTKYVSAAKAKDEASRQEIEHLRRTLFTHESTIQSLHVALQHAQDRSNAAVAESETSVRQCAVGEARAAELTKQHSATVFELRRQIASLEQRLRDQGETSGLALNSLKAESEVSAQYREEVEQLREEIKRLTDVKELAERSVYVTSQQLEVAKAQLQDSVRMEIQMSELKRRLEESEQRAQTVDQRVAAARREAKDHSERLMVEIGTLQERLRRATDEVAHAKRDLQTALVERDAARAELQQSRDIIHEMRNKMVHLSVMSLEAQSAGKEMTADATPMESILMGGERHLARLEEENGALRTELQHAFEDMRAVATSLKETRIVRERALEDVQRLEGEKTKLYEERQRLERQILEERMATRQRESELELQVLALRDELQVQHRRIELAHNDYQRKLQDHLNDTAARFNEEMGQERFNSAVRQKSQLGPNDPSQVPQRTPKSSVKTSAAPQTPLSGAASLQQSSAVYTLRSSSKDAQQVSGLVSTPRGTTAFRLSAASSTSAVRMDGPASTQLESPPR